MAKTTGLSKPSIIMNDKQYLDEYFQICALLMERRKTRRSLYRDADESLCYILKGSAIPPKLVDDREQKKVEKYNKVGAFIRRKDKEFWQRVKRGKKEGLNYLIEEIADKHELGLVEKRILLMFVYLEYTYIGLDALEPTEILNLVNIDDSCASRIKDAIYLSEKGALIKNQILKQGRDTELFSRNRQVFRIENEFLKMITLRVNGEEAEFPAAAKKENNLEQLNSAVKSVGYVKQPDCKFADVILDHIIIDRVKFFLDEYKDKMFEKLGVHKKIRKGKGVSFLFYGSPGTGKSMLAEAVADYIGKKILVVEFPKIQSKYYGESEKNISRAFRLAKEKDLVLVVNEADSMIFKREMCIQEHGIQEVNTLLNTLEEFEGVAIFTTNMDALLDHAVERRISLKIKFEVPGESLRQAIWKSHIPEDVRLANDVDFGFLAKKYEFSGGYIKNAALNAIRKMISRKGEQLQMSDMIFGADLEKGGMFTHNHETYNVIGFGSGN